VIVRNRTAWALLASLALCLFVLEPLEVPFNPVLWVAIDCAVIAAIVRRPLEDMSTRDIVIASMFAPAWVFYTMAPEVRYQGGLAVVVTQLLLCFPAQEVRGLFARRPKGKTDAERDGFELARA
jgi:hypothetical protein